MMNMKRIGDTLIKILSLGIGLAAGIVLIAKVCFELSYDSFYPDVKQIYRIRTGYAQQGEEKDFAQVSGAIAPGFKAEIPGVLEATRYTGFFASDQFYDESRNALKANLIVTDDSFFKVFSRPFLAGDPESALHGMDMNIAISRSFAEKLGGVNKAIGKQIWNESAPRNLLRVVGVFEDFPENGSFRFDILASIDLMGEGSPNNWVGNDRYAGFVKLAPGVDPASLQEAIRRMQVAHQPLDQIEKNGVKLWYFLDGFADDHRTQPDVRNQVLILSIVAFLLILISVLNYVLIAISDVIRRTREIGVRKCYGADDGNIYGIMLKETALNLGLSLLVALGVIFLFRGTVETLLSTTLKGLLIPQTFLVLAAVVAVVFLASTLIPARMLTRIPVSSAFRNYKESKRRWKLSLLAFQFAINTFLLILVLVAAAQYRKVLNKDVGYDYKNLVYARIPGAGQGKLYDIIGKLRSLPEVEGAELTYALPFDPAAGNNIYLPGDDRELFNIADEYGATEGFFDLMGFRLIEGAAPKTPKEIAVSQSFVDKMVQLTDWSDGAVGKAVIITEHSNSWDDVFTISGVYEDYCIHNAVDPDARPSVRFCWNRDDNWEGRFDWSQNMETVVVKLRTVNRPNRQAVEAVFREFLSDRPVEVSVYSETLRSLYDSMKHTKNTFGIGALMALLIAFIGLVGYIRDESNRRSAEIALRKVNGAQSGEIVKMFVLDILKIAIAAVVVGDVAAWFAGRKWLEQFPERVSLGAGYFLAGDLILLAIIVAMVILNCLRISRMNPVESLKNE